MLAVGIERHDELGALHQGEADAGLQCGALAEIDRVGDDGRAGGRGDRSGGVIEPSSTTTMR